MCNFTVGYQAKGLVKSIIEVMMNGRLYGNDEDFWTSNDEESEGESTSSSEEETNHEAQNTQRGVAYEALALAYKELIGATSQENQNEQNPLFVEGRGNIPEATLVPPTKRSIRKNWVIHDTQPIETFEDEIPNPALK